MDAQEAGIGSFYMKRGSVGGEHEQDTWLRSILRRSPGTPSESCLDAETLAAWADNALSSKAVAVVELHASNCPRCAAVLAAMERSAPPVPAVHAWTLARVFRWVAPLAAAAAAVAVWIAVPGRPVDSVQPERQLVVAPPESSSTVRDAASEAQGRSTSARRESPTAPAESRMRDELQRRDRSEADRFGAAAGAANSAMPTVAAPESAPTAAPVPAEPAADASAPPGVSETAELRGLQRSAAFTAKAMVVESVAPANPLIRWRVVGDASIERSLDGGKTWRRTSPPASSIVSVRAVDGDRAVARTADNADLYTTDGGRSWTRVQENSAAPF